MLIDSHCHILKSEYDNIKKVKEEIFSSDLGIKYIINNSFSIESIRELMNTEIFPNEYLAIGIGPDGVNNYQESFKEEIESYLNNKKVIAIGEIGLDYYWTKDNKDKQILVFKDMLSIAEKYNLPVIVHSRDSIQDTYNILKEYNVRGIMHCYSGSVEMANEFIKLGFLIGVGGVITFKNAVKLIDVVKSIEITNISLETDSPYLSPEPYRGKQNHPKNIVEIAKKIAEIKNIKFNEVAYKTTQNVISMFDLQD